MMHKVTHVMQHKINTCLAFMIASCKMFPTFGHDFGTTLDPNKAEFGHVQIQIGRYVFEYGDASHSCRPILVVVGGYTSPRDCHLLKYMFIFYGITIPLSAKFNICPFEGKNLGLPISLFHNHFEGRLIH